MRCRDIALWRDCASHSLCSSCWRLLLSRLQTLQAHVKAQTLGGQPGRTLHGTGSKRHMPVPARPYMSRFNASLASAAPPVPQAEATTEHDSSGCVTHMSTTTGQPGRCRRRSLRWGLRWKRGGSRAVPVAPPAWAATAAEGGVGGLGAGRAATAGIAVVTIVLGAAAALTSFRKAAAKASPGATAAEAQAAAASPGVGGVADTTYQNDPWSHGYWSLRKCVRCESRVAALRL